MFDDLEKKLGKKNLNFIFVSGKKREREKKRPSNDNLRIYRLRFLVLKLDKKKRRAWSPGDVPGVWR